MNITKQPIQNPRSKIQNGSDLILDALIQQVECYQRLAKLAEIQHEHVQHDQTEALLGVLQDRQRVLDEISRFERVIGPAKKDWSQYIGKLPSEARARAENLMGETRRLLEAITASDRNDALVLQQRKLNLGKQLGQAQAAKQVNRSYAASAYGNSRPSQMDVKVK